MSKIHTIFLPSTEKCFPEQKVQDKKPLEALSMLRNERLSFQLAYLPEAGRVSSELVITGGLSDFVRAFRVGYVSVRHPGIADDDYLKSETGLYPDVLTEIKPGDSVIAAQGELRSLIFTVECPEGLEPGNYSFGVSLRSGEDENSASIEITVIDALLPEQKLIHTQWFHNDCLATYYGVPVFSEQHWEIIGNYIEAAVYCGVNMLLTPVLTPPLDTAIGHERPTVQLVDVEVTDGSYKFSFDKLDRYIELALSKGIRYFEISHLFSQWGAIHAPKVAAKVDGVEKRIFGWETDASGSEYTVFIREFVTALLGELKRLGVDKQCWFHISDEPNISQLDSYRRAKDTVADLLDGYHIMDALSSYEFYETGAVETPIPATNHIEPFLEHKVPDLWTYYCCGQACEVSNRFIAMPGQRTRVLGEQLYRYDIKGFLQWGFNFWYSQGSLAQINPYLDQSGDDWVPAGDTFSVYPGADKKAVYSLHALHFYEALQDMRALELLGDKLGRDKVVSLLDFGSGGLTFRHYARNPGHPVAMRQIVNKLIGE